MDDLASGIKLYQSIVNHDKGLAYIFLPKCGGCSICEYLQELDPNWEVPAKDPVTPNDTKIVVPKHYKIFTVVREPVSWILSGYKMYKQRRGLDYTITEHLELIRNPHNLFTHYRDVRNDWGDWWWHCGITPDKHLDRYPNIEVFKLEHLDELSSWLEIYFPNNNVKIGHTNQTEREHIALSSYDHMLIDEIVHFYREKFEYDK